MNDHQPVSEFAPRFRALTAIAVTEEAGPGHAAAPISLSAHADLVDSLRAAENRSKQADQLNISLVAELDLLRTQIAKITAERDFYRGVSMDITTRLDVIQQTITTAVDAARRHAKVGMISVAMQETKNPAG